MKLREPEELLETVRVAVLTYTDQPNNVEASRLGAAARAAKRGGDSIDHGLSLLLELHARGYGIVRVDPMPAAEADKRRALSSSPTEISAAFEYAVSLWDRGLRADERPGIVRHRSVFDIGAAGATRVTPEEEFEVPLIVWAYMLGAVFGIGDHLCRREVAGGGP
jgi:hypothetical protein